MTNDPTPIGVAVVEHNGCFLAGPRPPNAPLGGLWEFPGGKVRPGESPEAAARRECLEEAGLAVQILGAYLCQVQQYDHGAVRLHFFACRWTDPSQRPRAPFRWIPRRRLAQLQFPEGNRRLLTLLLGSDEEASSPGRGERKGGGDEPPWC